MSEQKYYDSKTIDFITAKEAREMTNKVIEELIIKETLKKIKDAAKGGLNYCKQEVNEKFDIEVIMSFLRELGYTVSIVSFINFKCILKISW